MISAAQLRSLGVTIALIISVPSKAQSPGVFFSMGSADVSCRAFVRAAESNDAARQPDDPAGSYRNAEASGYMGWVEGFISGMNYLAPANRTAGQEVDPEDRFRWILNYCKSNPVKNLISAAMAFRDDLIARGM